MKIEIIRINVVTHTDGPDKLHLWTELPARLSSDNEDKAYAVMEVVAGEGIAYAKKHFPTVPAFEYDFKELMRDLVHG